jgi:hypothetical protein
MPNAATSPRIRHLGQYVQQAGTTVLHDSWPGMTDTSVVGDDGGVGMVLLQTIKALDT